MDTIFDNNFDIFSQLDAPVPFEPQSLSTQTTLDSSFDALLAELGLSPSAELASGLTSPTSSTASSVPPETPSEQVAALPPVSVVAATDTGKSINTAIDVDVGQVEQPKMAPVSSSAQLLAQPVQYDPRMLAMAHHQRILQTQHVMHAQACTDLQRLAAYYAQFGVHIPLLKPILMPYPPAAIPVPTPASNSTGDKSTKAAKGPVRTASKDARAAPYHTPAAARLPYNHAEAQADAEVFYQRRIAKELRRKEEIARAPKRVGVPSVMRLPAPNPSRA